MLRREVARQEQVAMIEVPQDSVVPLKVEEGCTGE